MTARVHPVEHCGCETCRIRCGRNCACGEHPGGCVHPEHHGQFRRLSDYTGPDDWKRLDAWIDGERRLKVYALRRRRNNRIASLLVLALAAALAVWVFNAVVR